jgi:Sec-independent protein secretion pathway component TatC
MTQDPLIFGDLPLCIKIILIGGAIILCPYLLIQAWREGGQR